MASNLADLRIREEDEDEDGSLQQQQQIPTFLSQPLMESGETPIRFPALFGSMTSNNSGGGRRNVTAEDEDVADSFFFTQKDLPNVCLPVMEDIRRMGKLCDVTIKVRHFAHFIFIYCNMLPDVHT